jgi:hypothetical protein
MRHNPKVYIVVSNETYNALIISAADSKRDTKMQAVFLLEEKLRELGYLAKQEPNLDHDADTFEKRGIGIFS